MTIPKTPNTSAHAVTKIAGLLGYDLCAKIVGRSKHAVRDWTNEDRSSCPSFAQALALDTAYKAAGGHGAPLLEAYEAQLDLAVTRATACQRELTTELAAASREFGDAFGATLPLTQPGHSENDTRRALIEIDQAEGALARLKRRAMSFLPGAGPIAGKPGGAHV